MSYLKSEKKSEFESAVREILQIRGELLLSFDYAKLLSLSYDEAVEFITSVKKSPGFHWSKLNTFLWSDAEEKAQFLQTLKEAPETVELPPVNVETLLRLSSLGEDRQRELTTKLRRATEVIVDALDLQKLAKKGQQKYNQDSVEITITHVYYAIYEMVQRLSQFKGSMEYLTRWLNAQTNNEFAFISKQAGSNRQVVSTEDRVGDEDLSVLDKIGEADQNLEDYENAEAEILLATTFLEAVKNVGITDIVKTEYQLLADAVETAVKSFRNQKLDEVHIAYDEVIDLVQVLSQKLPPRKRTTLLNETRTVVSAMAMR